MELSHWQTQDLRCIPVAYQILNKLLPAAPSGLESTSKIWPGRLGNRLGHYSEKPFQPMDCVGSIMVNIFPLAGQTLVEVNPNILVRDVERMGTQAFAGRRKVMNSVLKYKCTLKNINEIDIFLCYYIFFKL